MIPCQGLLRTYSKLAAHARHVMLQSWAYIGALCCYKSRAAIVSYDKAVLVR